MSNEYLNNKSFEAIIVKFQVSKKSRQRHVFLLENYKDILDRKSKRGTNDKKDQELVDQQKILLQQVIIEFNQNQQQLSNAFYTLARNIVQYAKFKMVDPDDAIQECVMVSFEKADRFNPERGRGFNYFTTLALNQLRQLYRGIRNYNELKRKFHEFSNLTMSGHNYKK